MTTARIFQKPKSAMQSGRGGSDMWILEFEPTQAKRADPLMGWAGSGDTQQQLRLTFATLDAAKAYVERKGIDANVIISPIPALKLQAYAENFR